MTDSTITLKLKTPKMPNFITVVGIRSSGGGRVGIGELTDDELCDFAEQWKIDLIEHGRERRQRLLDDQS